MLAKECNFLDVQFLCAMKSNQYDLTDTLNVFSIIIIIKEFTAFAKKLKLVC